jgi:hypothetical protein
VVDASDSNIAGGLTGAAALCAAVEAGAEVYH